MKKLKRILAFAGVLILIALYLTTLILAITDNSSTMQMFFVSVVATVIIPILIWIYAFIYRLLRKGRPDEDASK